VSRLVAIVVAAAVAGGLVGGLVGLLLEGEPSGAGIPTAGGTQSSAARLSLIASTQRITVDGVSADVGGDSIVAVDGRRIASAAGLGDLVARRNPENEPTVDVDRRSVTRTVRVTLGNAPSQ
jgi:S1-C subfamily serine protease